MGRARILVITVAEEPALAPLLPDALRRAGHEVEVTSHGPEALVRLATWPADLVVAEVRDLAREGGALAQIVRDRPAFEQLPLVAVVEDVSLREHAALLVSGYDRVTQAASAALTVPKAAADLFGTPHRVPSLLEAYARVAAMAPPARVAATSLN